MSCQQASKFSTTFSSVISEDPYVFTDTLPTKTPFLNTQELRAQFLDGDFTKVHTQTKPPILLTKSKTIYNRQTSPNETNNFTNKFAKQNYRDSSSPTAQHEHMIVQDNRTSTATKLTISAPIPIYQHTPSLWQTPLLLDTAGTVISPPTSPASLSSSPILTPTSNLIPNNNCIAATPITTTVISSPVSATTAPLPTSKFHHTTLAQHLKKVQCIKKLKKPTNASPPPLQVFSDALPATADVVASSCTSTTQHSADAELNDIPVNVIFRKPQQQQQQQQQQQVQLPTNTSSIATLVTASPAITTQSNAPANKQAHTAAGVVTSQSSLAKNANVKLLQPNNVNNASAQSKDVIFIHPKNNTDGKQLPTTIAGTIKTQKKSSNAQQQQQLTTAKRSQCPLLPISNEKNVTKAQTNTCNTSSFVVKRKPPAATVVNTSNNIKLPIEEHRISLNSNENLITPHGKAAAFAKGAVAVVKLLPIAKTYDDIVCDVDDDDDETAYDDLAYVMLQNVTSPSLQRFNAKLNREERISQHKNLLQRQAMQLVEMHDLLRPGQQTARQRLISVDRLLRQRTNAHCKKNLAKRCLFPDCVNLALDMALHCVQHVNETAMQLFSACNSLLSTKLHCRTPIIDKTTNHTIICAEQKNILDMPPSNNKEESLSMPTVASIQQRKTDLLFDEQKTTANAQMQPKQQQQQRKRKTHGNNNARLQKRLKKVAAATAAACRPLATQLTTAAVVAASTAAAATAVPTTILPIPCSISMQRKNSTTSLESIASNSHSSYSKLPANLPPNNNSSSNSNIIAHKNTKSTTTTQLPPPALAPLSNSVYRNHTNERQFSSIAAISSDFDIKELNQIVAQYADMAATAEHNNNNNYSNSNFNSLNNTLSNNNSNSSTHIRYNHHHNHHNSNSSSSNMIQNYSNNNHSNSNNSYHHHHSHQDILSFSENSSIYASSEDTGLGGLSETELMAGSNDADDMPLGDTRLLEEHDLANVLSALPEDAFNELFSSVQQDDGEVERALELADEHLKTLQQTISSDSNLFVDFPDFSDEVLNANLCNRKEITTSVLHSPDTSGIDISALLLDNGVNSGETDCGTAASNCSGDVRGLVQT